MVGVRPDRRAEVGREAGDEAGGIALTGGQRQPFAGLPRGCPEREHLVETPRRRVEAERAEKVRPVARHLRRRIGRERPDPAEVVGAGRRPDALALEHGEELRREQRAEVAEAAGRPRPAAEGMIDDDEVELLRQHLDRLDAEIAEAPPRPGDLDVGMEGGEKRRPLRQRIVAAWMVPGDAAEPAGHRLLPAARAAVTRATTGVPVVSVATLVMCHRPRLVV